MICRAVGFAPVWDGESVALILGSFPSVKSRKTDFYYGNPQNKFWRLVFGFFGEEVPRGNEDKK
ncbi:MAG: DNA-deoxyinosine glycosylase, partial [Candidatus Gallimonas sp.]